MPRRYVESNVVTKQSTGSCQPSAKPVQESSQCRPGTARRDTLSRLAAVKLWAVVLCTLIFLPLTAAVAVPDAAPDNGQAADNTHRRQVEQQTLILARMMAGYRQADESGKARLFNALVDQARERQATLAELAQTDPAGALRVVLPAKVRAGMPTEVQELLAQKKEFRGELEISYEDYADGRHRLRYVLQTATRRSVASLLWHPPCRKQSIAITIV